MADDKGVDAVLALIVPTAVADLVPTICAALPVPSAAVLLGQSEAVRLLPGTGDGDPPVPAYAYPESAAKALARAAKYGEWVATPAGTVPDLDHTDAAGARSLIASFFAQLPGGGWLPPAVTSQLLRRFGLPLVDTQLASDSATAARTAAELGGPVVMKANVPGLLHKTDAGAVRLDLRSPPDAGRAFDELAAKFGDQLAGVLVQPMITGGVEVIIGVVQEPVFGPLVVFGLGGVATEVLGDHSARLAPLTGSDANSMIQSIRAAPLLLGHRGTPAVDLAGLTDTLLRVSRLADDLPEIAELDLNPVIARSDGVFAVDARIRVTSQAAADPFLRRLR